MVSSKPLPPIPAPPASEKRAHHLFSSVTLHHRKKSDSTATAVAINDATTTTITATKPNTAAAATVIGVGTSTTSSTSTATSKTITATAAESHLPQPQAQPIPASNSFFSFLSSAVSTIRSTNASTTPTATRSSSPAPSTVAGSTEETTLALTDTTDPANNNNNLNTTLKAPMVTLDQRSLQHLRAIARQSIASSCLEPEFLWLGLLMDMLQKLSMNVSDAWQQIEASFESTDHLDALNTTNTATTVTEKNLKDKVKEKVKDKEKEKGKNQEEAMPHFGYSIQLVKNISTTQECTFTAGQFRGESILLEERPIEERKRPPKQEPIQILLGGTIALTAGADDLAKVEKILELLVFALCSMQLEMYLMQDHDIVRHEPSLFSPLSHDSESRKPSIPAQQQNAINNSKRASKGSMIFSWLSRGTLPAKYKKGTTQLSAQLDKQAVNGRDGSSSVQSTTTPSLAEDLGLGEDLHSYQSYRFAKIIQQIDKAIISVSPDVSIPPPHLLLRLRNEEAIGPDSKRKSYTWEDVEFVAKKIGFGNRMGRPKINGALGQVTRFGTTTSTATNQTNATGKGDRLPIDSRAGLDHLMTNGNALQGIFNHQSISFSHSYYWSATAAAPCELPKVITMEYYRKEGAYEDMDLGEMIEYLCWRAHDLCHDKKCGHKRLEHISTYAHGEARINITLEQPRPDSATDFDSEEFAPFLANNKTMAVWTRCKMCKARTKPRMVSRASRIYSFGKYLELLLYNQHFEPGPRPLCDHALSKDAIARCFLYRGLVVNFEVESIDLFEMRISRLQVKEDFPTMPILLPGDWSDDHPDLSTASSSTVVPSSQVSMVSMSAHCDYITDAEHANQINSTRLEIMHFYESCKKIIVAMEEHFGETKSVVKRTKKHDSSTRTTTVDPTKKAALASLDDLGDRWKADEFELYDQLKRIPITRLNDLRNRFKDYIKRTMRSMESWQTENYPDLAHSLNSWALPEYVTSDILHTFPRSSVIVRENEPSSIIASTLSLMDYLTLLSSMCNQDVASGEEEEAAPKPPEKDLFMRQAAQLGVPAPGPLRTSRSAGSATLVTRKSGSSDSESTAVNSAANGSPNKADNGSQASTQDDDDDEGGDEDFLVVDGYETTVKFVKPTKLDISSMLANGTMSPRSTMGIHFASGRHGKNSTLGLGSIERRADGTIARPVSMMALNHSTPVFTASPLTTPSENNNQATSFFVSPPDSRSTTPTPGGKSKNTFGYHALTSGLSGTMKGLSLNALSEKIGSGFTSYGASSANIDKADKEFFKAEGTERTIRETLALEQELESSVRSPHLKARFSHGKTSFSCTVYYAAEFDTLRRRCGIHQNYVQSLSRCKVWNANGGKSKSSFYKTKDDRFVVKQMVSSWNIAEKDELLKFAPKYFDYMEKTHGAPTVLAKIFGFYTFKIKNGQSGQAMKIDVLVMEHLFFNQKITRTFDLKGIQDRHAGSKPNATGGGSTTLWDGDFIEGRYKALLLIHSHSKKIIRESLLNDTEFLAAANIMDYSLLVGVDDERKELVVGIVDFIGAYTWYKRIESRGKTTLRGAKDNVTVLPPQQYKTRFREAMERYFLAVPDKWSKAALEQENTSTTTTTTTTATGTGTIIASRKTNAIDGAIVAASTALLLPSTIPEGSKESLSTPTTAATALEQSLKKKTSGYLEKMSKAIVMSSSRAGGGVETGSGSVIIATAVAAEGTGETEFLVKKLPRVFYPLD
ncbi:hypothetical protein BGZ95_004303 [Linnemannia exigua]|uniref:PIPK domain-containing protein n=1 Tax=Linnemannia exigua TaxID=604196 RepID=A0AAD4D589_9FUNG|nr:hypothetical protein BGZ95_004303 [Linnemannia exigua]